jgi:DNA invertase Pin-like site-specific DNA recombinase
MAKRKQRHESNSVEGRVRQALLLMRRHRNGKPNLLGYARVSTKSQDLARQLDALEKAGCSRVFSEKVSGVARFRPAWEELVGQLRPGDVVVVHAVDRLGRSMAECMRCFTLIAECGAYLRCTSQPIDTSAPGYSAIMLPFVFAMTESTRIQIVERTKEGLAAARERGRVGGRPTKLTAELKALVRHMHAQDNTPTVIAEALRISRRSVGRALESEPSVNARQARLDMAI